MRGLTKEYVLRRGGLFFLTILISMTILFIIPRLAPGDPVASMVSRMTAQGGFVENSDQLIAAWRAKFGLDKPLIVQYLSYLKNMVTLNFGYSLAYFPAPVHSMVRDALPWTIGLLSVATLISFITGNIIGAFMAWRKTPGVLRALLPFTLTFTSIPPFMLSILLLYIFSFGLNWLPFSGGYDLSIMPALSIPFIKSIISHSILPALSIVVCSMGSWALGMRGMMITTAGEDYVTLAEAKGLSSARIFFRYEMRNAILPQLTALALSLGSLAGGSVIIEYIFSYPGIGYLMYTAVTNNDYTLLQGIMFMLTTSVSLGVLIIDLLYPVIDPRISYQGK
ncbi:MAG: ABC transporter permease [Fibrobacteres bacterium]|nr:ABC transporter permease [Fibrobacterota bacterium]